MEDKDRRESRIRQIYCQFPAFWLTLCDIVSVQLAYFLALWLNFGCSYSRIPKQQLIVYIVTITPFAIIAVTLFWLFRIYMVDLRNAGPAALIRFVGAAVCVSILYIVILSLFFLQAPLSYHVEGCVIQLALFLFSRFVCRL